jgi:hypothetical protein
MGQRSEVFALTSNAGVKRRAAFSRVRLDEMLDPSAGPHTLEELLALIVRLRCRQDV